MTSDVPRTIFDCNVLLQAFLSKGPAFHCLELVDMRQVELVLSPVVLEEVRDVFTRPALVRKYPQLSAERVSAFLALLTRRARTIESVPHRVDFPRDPKDEPYLDLACASNAAYLLTRDQDLLSLPHDTSAEADMVRRLCPNLRVLDPVAFLTVIRAAR